MTTQNIPDASEAVTKASVAAHKAHATRAAMALDRVRDETLREVEAFAQRLETLIAQWKENAEKAEKAKARVEAVTIMN